MLNILAIRECHNDMLGVHPPYKSSRRNEMRQALGLLTRTFPLPKMKEYAFLKNSILSMHTHSQEFSCAMD